MTNSFNISYSMASLKSGSPKWQVRCLTLATHFFQSKIPRATCYFSLGLEAHTLEKKKKMTRKFENKGEALND